MNKKIIYAIPIAGVRVLRFKAGYYEARQAWRLMLPSSGVESGAISIRKLF